MNMILLVFAFVFMGVGGVSIGVGESSCPIQSLYMKLTTSLRKGFYVLAQQLLFKNL
jgi:hypothetical protein